MKLIDCQITSDQLYMNERVEKIFRDSTIQILFHFLCQTLITHIKWRNKYKYQIALLNMFPTPQQKTQNFLKIIEAGDLALYEPFNEALAVFGFTKAGKTSTCHMLANSTLKAELKNGDLIYRPVSNVRFAAAKIGLTNESETEIPNVFEATFKDKAKNAVKMTILDQPGYGDSYGFHRIFSNGYFHYRTLSKTPKLKFLVVLERKDLSGVAEKLKKVIFLFINSFTPYEKMRSSILGATCFLISKAEVGTKLSDITSILTTLRDTMGGMTVAKRAFFQEFIDNMIDNNKVFIVEKPKAAGNETQANAILQSICEKTEFWERKMVGSCADMSQVNFSVAGEVLSEMSAHKDNELFIEDFDAFMVEIKHKIKDLMKADGNPSSLRNIVTQLMKDAMDHSESSQFLQGMTQFNNKFYTFDQNFSAKREKLEATLFQVVDNSNLELSDSRNSPGKRLNEDKSYEKEKRENDRRLLYFIKKFNVLSYIASEAKRLMDEDYEIFNKRNHQTLERLSTFFVDIFRKFDCLRSERKGYEKTISRYCYIIQRLIDESKIMIQILFSDNETRDKFINLKQDLILNAEILFTISEIITYFQGIPVKDMKREFIEKLDLDNLGFPINKEVIDFFESVSNLQLETQIKIAKILLKYNSELAINKKVNLHEEMQFVGQKLLKYHELFAFEYTTADKKLKDELTEILFLITKAIGDILAKNSYFEPGREVLKTIQDAEGIFQLFELQLKSLQSNDPSIRGLYVDYAKTAAYFQRTELAVRCCQQAYSRSTGIAQIKVASELLIKVTTKQPEDSKVEYLSKLYREEFCGRLESKLLDIIKPAFGISEY